MSQDETPFLVSASESLLLGFCVGAYKYDPVRTFIEFLRERLGRLIPDFGFLSTDGGFSDTVPSDVVWIEFPDNKELLGVTADRPWTVYHSKTEFRVLSEGKQLPFVWNATTVNFERKSLIDLLLVHFGQHMRLSRRERFLRTCLNTHGIENNWDRWVRIFAAGPNVLEKYIEPETKVFELDTIDRELAELVGQNGYAEPYEVGTLFGEAYGKMRAFYNTFDKEPKQWRPREAFEISATKQEEAVHDNYLQYDLKKAPERASDYSAYIEELPGQDELDELLTVRVIEQSFAGQLIRSMYGRLIDNTAGWSDVPEHRWSSAADDSWDALQIRLRAEVLDCLEDIWVALFEVGNAYRRDENCVQTGSAITADPRAFAKLACESPDEAEKRVREVSLMLDRGSIKPHYVITLLGPMLEELVERFWPKEHDDVGIVLRRHAASSSDELEKRFVFIARPLYLNYRNPATHEALDFTCSFSEAKYFVAGLTAMIQLWREQHKSP